MKTTQLSTGRLIKMTETQYLRFFNEMNGDQKVFFNDVLAEMHSAEEKHKNKWDDMGPWPENAMAAAYIVANDVQELVETATTYDDNKVNNIDDSDAFTKMTEQSVDVAAMALRFWRGLGNSY